MYYHHSRKFSHALSQSILNPIPKTNHSFFFCHRLDLPVLELYIYNYTIWIILCKASFTSYSFEIYPYCYIYHFFCFFVHCMDILWFVYSFSCWWIIGCFQAGAVMNKLPWTFLFVCGHIFSFLLTKFSRLQLLSHKI